MFDSSVWNSRSRGPAGRISVATVMFSSA
jgi:hypothetical protein